MYIFFKIYLQYIYWTLIFIVSCFYNFTQCPLPTPEEITKPSNVFSEVIIYNIMRKRNLGLGLTPKV